MNENNMYKLGAILKSKIRTSPLFVMVCDDGTIGRNLDQSSISFRAVVMYSECEDHAAGEVSDNWNKGEGKWEKSNYCMLFIEATNPKT